jgi:serine/threonine protein kinase
MPGEAGDLVGGRYLLDEPVGQGGMGRVWRARDQLLDRVVAVKEVVLPPQSPGEHVQLLARTMQEARAAARLDHPGVVTIHDVVEHDDTPWIVMQYIPGTSLGAQVAVDGPLPWQRAAQIGSQVADALAHAHAAGIVHRDLKPDNILLSGDRAVVTDFGIARIIDAPARLTSAGTRVGTVVYMSPEQLEGSDAGPAVDMWALGVTLYATIEGKPPFSGPTLTALMTAILTKPLAPPAHAGPLAAQIEALLAKDAAQRPTAREAARALADRQSPRDEVAVGGLGLPAQRQQANSAGAVAERVTPPQADLGPGDTASIINLAPPVPPQSVSSPPEPAASGGQRRAPAESAPSGESPGTAPSRGAGRSRRRPSWKLWAPAAGVLGVAGVVAALTLPGSGSPPAHKISSGPPPLHAGTPVLAHTLTVPGTAGTDDAQLSPDGKLLAADNATVSSIYVWNATTGAYLRKLTPPPSSTGTAEVYFSPDDKTLTALTYGAKDYTLYRWDLATGAGTAIRTLPNAQQWALSGDESKLFTPSGDNVTLTNVSGGAVIAHLSLPPTWQDVSTDDSGNEIMAASANGTAYVWDVATGKIVAHVTYRDKAAPGASTVNYPFLSPDGKTIVVSSNTSAPYSLWDVATGANITPKSARWAQDNGFCLFSDDGRVCGTQASNLDTIDIWDIATHRLLLSVTDQNVTQNMGVAAIGPNSSEVVVFGPWGPSNTLSHKLYVWTIP